MQDVGIPRVEPYVPLVPVQAQQIVVSAGTAFKMGFYGLIGAGVAYLLVLLIPTVIIISLLLAGAAAGPFPK